MSGIKKIVNEWEILLFILSLMCSGVYLYAANTEEADKKDVASVPSAVKSEVSAFSDTTRLFNLVFPDEISAYNLKKINDPFYLGYPDLPEEDDGEKSATEEEKKNGKGGEKSDETEKKDDEKDAAEEEQNLREYKIKYCGSINGDDGKGLALVKDVKKNETHYVGIGESVLAVKIVECGSKSVTIQLPSGEKKSLKFGETMNFKVRQ